MYSPIVNLASLTLLGCVGGVKAASTLLAGGTVIAFDSSAESLQVLRNGSVLVTDDRIVTVAAAGEEVSLPSDTVTINVTDKIISPGFVDTHHHGWQTFFKTLGSNTSLVEYFGRYGEFASAGLIDADDVYVSQLAGIYEALNAGVTTILDHAHHT
jgi:cytosine/adenosine deaminase-related metal-dependent hydrolase